MIQTIGYASQNTTTPLTPFSFQRRDPGPQDIQIQILFCGVCHSDIHQARNEWHSTTYPCVPGHEIVGRVIKAGSQVKNFKEGDIAGVGCMVDSCRKCSSCQNGTEQFCKSGPIFTYNSEDKHTKGITYGGYSQTIVVDEAFVLRIPKELNLPAVAPLLCAGITTYSPLRYWKIGKGHKVGIVGLGGLGHMAVKFAHAFGSHVVFFTTSQNKISDAKKLGAHEVVLSTHKKQMEQHLESLDFILDTVSAEHDLSQYLELLKQDGIMTLVGAPEKPLPIATFNLIMRRRKLTGSLIGGIRETQEMLDFCAKHNIVSEVEMIPIQKINEAYERILKNDVRYRFVIDMSSLK